MQTTHTEYQHKSSHPIPHFTTPPQTLHFPSQTQPQLQTLYWSLKHLTSHQTTSSPDPTSPDYTSSQTPPPHQTPPTYPPPRSHLPPRHTHLTKLLLLLLLDASLWKLRPRPFFATSRKGPEMLLGLELSAEDVGWSSCCCCGWLRASEEERSLVLSTPLSPSDSPPGGSR